VTSGRYREVRRGRSEETVTLKGPDELLSGSEERQNTEKGWRQSTEERSCMGVARREGWKTQRSF
jgi:hypothetical protein